MEATKVIRHNNPQVREMRRQEKYLVLGFSLIEISLVLGRGISILSFPFF